MTVASSRHSSSLNDFLRNMGIAPLFQYVLGADNVKKAKPDPEPVLQTLRATGYRADEALMVWGYARGYSDGSKGRSPDGWVHLRQFQPGRLESRRGRLRL